MRMYLVYRGVRKNNCFTLIQLQGELYTYVLGSSPDMKIA